MSGPMRLYTAEGRRAAAFAAIVLGCIAMTLYSAWALLLVKDHPRFVFWLGMAGHAQILVGLTGLAALFVKRTVKVGREGIEITDSAEPVATVETKTVVSTGGRE